MLDLSPMQEELGVSLASEGVGLAGPVGFCFFGTRGRSSVDGRFRIGLDVSSSGCSNSIISEKRTPATAAFVIARVAIRVETSSS